jgi:hypothetical protein
LLDPQRDLSITTVEALFLRLEKPFQDCPIAKASSGGVVQPVGQYIEIAAASNFGERFLGPDVDDGGLLLRDEAKRVHQGSLALPIPDQEPYRGGSRHFPDLGRVIVKVSRAVRRIDPAKRPLADVVPWTLAGAKHLDEVVPAGVQVTLDGFIRPVGVPDYDGKPLLDDPIQSLPDLDAQAANPPRPGDEDGRQR